MGTNGRYVPNDAGFQALAVGDEIRAACLAEAERAQVIAQGLAADFTVTGEYESSFDTRSDTVPLATGYGTHAVAAGILENTADHAAAVEWGNAHDHQPHRVFGRTLEAMGG
jgi:hypothetical protein